MGTYNYYYDIARHRYQAAIKQLSTSIRHAREEVAMAQRDSSRAAYGGWPGAGRGDSTMDLLSTGVGTGPDVHQLEKEIERQQAVLDQLPRDLEAQKKSVLETEELMKQTAPEWSDQCIDKLRKPKCLILVSPLLSSCPFSYRLSTLEPSARASFASEFATFCLLPRILNSPADALYAARFLQRVQQLRVPRFGLLTTINHVSLLLFAGAKN